MATHITGLLLAALVIWRAPKLFDDHLTDAALRRHGPSGAWALLGLAPAGFMALSQIVLTPPAVYRGGESQEYLAAISPHAVPLAGSPDAAWVVTLLFDYQCPHCQQLHFMLPEVIRRHGGRLAFALRPVPMERPCNPYIPRDVEAFKDSCELARTGLAVWLAKREAFPAFELWMFSLESGDRWRPRSPGAARAKAIELVGQAKFDAALADPWIAGYLQTSVRIFGNTGSTAIPKCVFGSRWVIPQPQDAGQLAAILEHSLGVPKP
jgi:protein-disulfide isomerase